MKRLLIISLIALFCFGATGQEIKLGVNITPQLINTYETNLEYKLSNSPFSITFKYGKMIDRTSKFWFARMDDGKVNLVSNGEHLALGGRYYKNNLFAGVLLTHSTYTQEGHNSLLDWNPIFENELSVEGDMYAVGFEIGKIVSYGRFNFLTGFQLNYLLNYDNYVSKFSSPSGVGRFVMFNRKIAPQIILGASYSIFNKQ